MKAQRRQQSEKGNKESNHAQSRRSGDVRWNRAQTDPPLYAWAASLRFREALPPADQAIWHDADPALRVVDRVSQPVRALAVRRDDLDRALYQAEDRPRLRQTLDNVAGLGCDTREIKEPIACDVHHRLHGDPLIEQIEGLANVDVRRPQQFFTERRGERFDERVRSITCLAE